MTDSNTCLFSVPGLFSLIVFWNNMSKDVCICQCVCVAVNSYGCYIWILDDVIDCNTFFLLQILFVSFYSFLE